MASKQRAEVPTAGAELATAWANFNAAARDFLAIEEGMFLPPYSPDFNPIEQVFAKLKALLRKAAARTIDTLEAAIATALDAFTPSECANYFTNSGYKPD